jgi:hypothetical protein
MQDPNNPVIPREGISYIHDIGNVPTLNHYTKLVFFERFEQMVFATHEYDGLLPGAWATAQLCDVAGVDATRLSHIRHELDNQQEAEVAKAVGSMVNSGIATAIVEAAHVYAHEDLADPQLEASLSTQVQFAAGLTDRLQEAGIGVRQMLFIDDYNPDANGERVDRLDVDELVSLTQSFGYYPEIIMREGSMVDLAKKIIEIMDEKQGLVSVLQDEAEGAPLDDVVKSTKLLAYRKHELYRGSDDMVSCAMLDTALTALKFRYLGEGVINVLPRSNGDRTFSYRSQQRKMRTILGEHLNVRISPIFNLFTGNKTQDAIATGAHHAFRKQR